MATTAPPTTATGRLSPFAGATGGPTETSEREEKSTTIGSPIHLIISMHHQVSAGRVRPVRPQPEDDLQGIVRTEGGRDGQKARGRERG